MGTVTKPEVSCGMLGMPPMARRPPVTGVSGVGRWRAREKIGGMEGFWKLCGL
jgi:hypothetical protein